MVTINQFKKLALSLPGASEEPHFEKTSFRVKKKIFATLSEENSMGVVKLSEIDQSVFSAFDRSVIFPVDNKWGKQGWTAINLKKVRKDMLEDALTSAYNEVIRSKTKK